MSEKPRVLHAPIAALYQPWLYAEGLRAAGCQADYMCANVSDDLRWLMHSVDIDLGLDNSKTVSERFFTELDFLMYAMETYDVFHFHSGFSLLSNHAGVAMRLSDLSLLKKLGKKIVLHWWGWCERRTDAVEARYHYVPCRECPLDPAQWCRRPERALLDEWADRYADLQLANGALCAVLPQARWCNNAVDTDLWRPMPLEEIPAPFRLPTTKNLRIYHSFGNSQIRGDVKGSRYIREAVEALHAEGHPVEFMFFDKVPNLQLRYYQAQVDIVVDQLHDGWHGTTAVEGLACGKPVVTFIHPMVARIAPPHHPLIHATVDTIRDVLRELIVDRDYRREVGARSRDYALREHSHIVMGKRLLALYQSL